MTADYYDYRWTRIMEPLCEGMQRWKEGHQTHAEMEKTLEVAHDEICDARSLDRRRQDRLGNLAGHWDRAWFESWVEEHSSLRDTAS